MDKNLLFSILAILLIAGILFFFLSRKKNSNVENINNNSLELEEKNTALALNAYSGKPIMFEPISSLTNYEESRLVEIKDHHIIEQIDNVIPKAVQSTLSSKTATETRKFVDSTKDVYHVIIEKGATLDKSHDMEGALRATYHRADGKYGGQANLVTFDPEDGKKLVALNAGNVANAAMNIGSMVVGQYYMSQINQSLKETTESINEISGFLENEYRSKVQALVAEVYKISQFEYEIMDNNELRNRELQHLKELETKCAELLGQANLSLEDISKRTDVDYKTYESLVSDTYHWNENQKMLLQVMKAISDLTYAMNLGDVSVEYSYALFQPFCDKAQEASLKLKSWNDEICNRLDINVDAAWRKRKGLDGFIMALPGQVNSKYKYKSIPKETVQKIRIQNSDSAFGSITSGDLLHKDVQLIAKGDKFYYLPD